jgi:hypothetical protein
VDVASNGEININYAATSPYVSLDGLSFSTAGGKGRDEARQWPGMMKALRLPHSEDWHFIKGIAKGVRCSVFHWKSAQACLPLT